MAGRPPNPQSRRQRAINAGISPSTLARRDKGAKPRKAVPVVERCENCNEICEVPCVDSYNTQDPLGPPGAMEGVGHAQGHEGSRH